MSRSSIKYSDSRVQALVVSNKKHLHTILSRGDGNESCRTFCRVALRSGRTTFEFRHTWSAFAHLVGLQACSCLYFAMMQSFRGERGRLHMQTLAIPGARHGRTWSHACGHEQHGLGEFDKGMVQRNLQPPWMLTRARLGWVSPKEYPYVLRRSGECQAGMMWFRHTLPRHLHHHHHHHLSLCIKIIFTIIIIIIVVNSLLFISSPPYLPTRLRHSPHLHSTRDDAKP